MEKPIFKMDDLGWKTNPYFRKLPHISCYCSAAEVDGSSLKDSCKRSKHLESCKNLSPKSRTTLPETNIAPEKMVVSRKFLFQWSIFRCYVSFREGITAGRKKRRVHLRIRAPWKRKFYLPNHHFSGSIRSSLGVYHPDSVLGTRLRKGKSTVCINAEACIS